MPVLLKNGSNWARKMSSQIFRQVIRLLDIMAKTEKIPRRPKL